MTEIIIVLMNLDKFKLILQMILCAFGHQIFKLYFQFCNNFLF